MGSQLRCVGQESKKLSPFFLANLTACHTELKGLGQEKVFKFVCFVWLILCFCFLCVSKTAMAEGEVVKEENNGRYIGLFCPSGDSSPVYTKMGFSETARTENTFLSKRLSRMDEFENTAFPSYM